MNKENVIEKLRDDQHYYGDFGKKYLSNSDISALLTNPLALGKPSEPRPAFLVGGYFHTAILEPDKLKKYKVIPSSTRNTKVYKCNDNLYLLNIVLVCWLPSLFNTESTVLYTEFTDIAIFFYIMIKPPKRHNHYNDYLSFFSIV